MKKITCIFPSPSQFFCQLLLINLFTTFKANNNTKHGLNIFGRLVTLFLNSLWSEVRFLSILCKFISLIYKNL